jgi:uncharacterized protein (TIGR02118 family)
MTEPQNRTIPHTPIQGMILRMIILTVLYSKTDSSHFDHEYYRQKHIPLVHSIWGGLGLERVDLMRGMGALDGGSPAYELIVALSFTSMEDVQNALSKGAEIMADIPNFSNVQPIIQLSQPIAA